MVMLDEYDPPRASALEISNKYMNPSKFSLRNGRSDTAVWDGLLFSPVSMRRDLIEKNITSSMLYDSGTQAMVQALI